MYWSGQAQRFPALQRCGPAPKWGEMSEQARKELLVAADQLNFDFVEEVLQVGVVCCWALLRTVLGAQGWCCWHCHGGAAAGGTG